MLIIRTCPTHSQLRLWCDDHTLGLLPVLCCRRTDPYCAYSDNVSFPLANCVKQPHIYFKQSNLPLKYIFKEVLQYSMIKYVKWKDVLPRNDRIVTCNDGFVLNQMCIATHLTKSQCHG